MMNLLEQYEVLSKTDSIRVVDKNIMVYYPLNLILNSEGEDIHSLIDSFAIIFWRNISDGTVVTSINFSPPILTYVEEKSNESMTKMHRHDYIEMAYVIKGEFSQFIAGKKRTFSQGSVCIIDRNCEHADYVEDQDNFVLFICMNENFFDEMFLSELENSNVHKFIRRALLEQKNLKQYLQFTPKRHDLILPLIEQVCAEIFGNHKGVNYIVKGLIIRIFFYLTMDYEINLNETQLKKMNDLLFIEVEEYLRKNYKDVSLKELSSRFHFQEDYFNRLIKKHTGLTFTEFLKKIRISKAEDMLLNTRMSITEIVDSVGYMNRSYFYKLFQKTYNMTPEQYRKKVGARND
jgi:YesN/AraC family two-component response regulator